MNQPSSPQPLDVDQVSRLRETHPNMRLIDVRSPGEFAGVHIPGSYNVPLDLLREHRNELRAAHEDPVVLVCASGARADQAQRLVTAAGLEQVHVLRGGLAAWQDAGAPVTRGRGPWAMERQVRLTAGSLVLLAVVASLLFDPLKWVAAFVGAGLVFAAVTNTCGMARLLALLPFNRSCAPDAPARIASLTEPAPAAR
ncbi:rhodanese-like domain-containing protein [Salinactinospora qingdaonensis]|uniref:Rhodanese-like domain-containing protein n=1 Tax=Salinactinospora qingdaonensis TaxID=702744 RepID=A0ABP7GEF0_9ACTN